MNKEYYEKCRMNGYTNEQRIYENNQNIYMGQNRKESQERGSQIGREQGKQGFQDGSAVYKWCMTAKANGSNIQIPCGPTGWLQFVIWSLKGVQGE